MIKKCNFKDKLIQRDNQYDCVISKYLCCGEDNCILYQTYNNTRHHSVEEIDKEWSKWYEEHKDDDDEAWDCGDVIDDSKEDSNFPEDKFDRILCEECGHMAVKKEDNNCKCPHCDGEVVKW